MIVDAKPTLKRVDPGHTRAVPSPRFCFSNRPRTLSPPLVGALSLVEYLESEVRLKKSRADLKELSPALGEAMVPRCEDDAAGAARAARIGLRWRLHTKVHLDEPKARIHTAPSHANYFRSTGSRFQRRSGPSDDLQHQLHRVPHRGLSRAAGPALQEQDEPTRHRTFDSAHYLRDAPRLGQRARSCAIA